MAVFQGTAGKDSFIGTSSYDTFEGKGGDDKIQGGDSDLDLAIYSGAFADYTITYDPVTHWYRLVDSVAGRDGTDLVRGVEYFKFSDSPQQRSWSDLVPHQGDGLVLRGDDAPNGLAGGTGLDKLYGYGGDDVLHGRSGDDLILAGDGDDFIRGDAGDDTIDGGAGVDTAWFGHPISNYTITYDPVTRYYRISQTTPVPNFENTGTDLVRNVEWFYFYGGNKSPGELVPKADGGIVVTGPDTGDMHFASPGADKMYGNGGNDLLVAFVGNDYLSGGDGDDVMMPDYNYYAGGLVVGGGNDVVEGGEGIDTVVYSGNFQNYAITYDSVTRRYRLVDTVGGEGTDLVRGVEKFLFDDGLKTWGELVPHQGDGVVLRGSDASNFLQGGGGLDTLIGNEGNDWLQGLGADDRLIGGAGNDTLSGGAGVDHLQGQGGMDTYVFDAPLTGEMDLVVDFATAFDTFQLDASVFSALLPGALNANAFQSAASTEALSTDARVLFDTASGNLYYDADGMGGTAAIAFANVNLSALVGSITHADFFIVA